MLPVLVGIQHASRLAVSIMLNLHDHRFRSQVEFSSRFGFGNFGIESRPLRSGLASLKTKSQLPATRPPIARSTINRHPAGMNSLISDACSTVVHDLEVVVAGKPRNVIGARDTHLGLGLGIVRLEFR